MLELIDIGVNLTHDSFDRDRDDVMAAADAAGVRRMIVTGTSIGASRAAADLARTRPAVLFATAGVHPHHASELEPSSIAALRGLLSDPGVVAVGECGLDFYRDFSSREDQRTAFVAQLELAAEAALPVFLHQRDAHAEFVEIMRSYRARLAGGVAHCFTGGRKELAELLALDLYVGITGWVCDERRGRELREALPDIPLDRLLLETDAPYLAPRDMRPFPKGRRNEPAFLRHVAERVATWTNRPIETIARASTENAERLFRLPVEQQRTLL
jgi:TatD DNase family protein